MCLFCNMYATSEKSFTYLQNILKPYHWLKPSLKIHKHFAESIY